MTLPEFAPIFAMLALQLRAADVDEFTIRAYHEGLADLDVEIVREAALRIGRSTDGDGKTWFPRTGEWRRVAGVVERERRQAQAAALRQLPAPLCGTCGDTGWARGDDERVRPCECRDARRRELLGQQLPPALPPARAVDERLDAIATFAALARRGLRLAPRSMPSASTAPTEAQAHERANVIRRQAGVLR